MEDLFQKEGKGQNFTHIAQYMKTKYKASFASLLKITNSYIFSNQFATMSKHPVCFTR